MNRSLYLFHTLEVEGFSLSGNHHKIKQRRYHVWILLELTLMSITILPISYGIKIILYDMVLHSPILYWSILLYILSLSVLSLVSSGLIESYIIYLGPYIYSFCLFYLYTIILRPLNDLNPSVFLSFHCTSFENQ